MVHLLPLPPGQVPTGLPNQCLLGDRPQLRSHGGGPAVLAVTQSGAPPEHATLWAWRQEEERSPDAPLPEDRHEETRDPVRARSTFLCGPQDREISQPFSLHPFISPLRREKPVKAGDRPARAQGRNCFSINGKFLVSRADRPLRTLPPHRLSLTMFPWGWEKS